MAMSGDVALPPEEPMIRITIAYPRVEDRAFDHDYFSQQHLPRLLDRVGHAVTRLSVERGLDALPWPDAEHEVVCSLECEDLKAFEAAFFPHIDELQDDLDRCGGAPPTIHVGEVVVDRNPGGHRIPMRSPRLRRFRPPLTIGRTSVTARG